MHSRFAAHFVCPLAVMKNIITRPLWLLAAPLLMLFVYWSQELGGGNLGDSLTLLGIAILGSVVLPLFAIRGVIWKILGILLCVSLTISAWNFGATQNVRAFNDCVKNGDLVRIKLEHYKTQNGIYPANLKQIKKHLCGRRPLSGTILNYKSTPNSYELWFGSFVTHRATDKEDFMAHK